MAEQYRAASQEHSDGYNTSQRPGLLSPRRQSPPDPFVTSWYSTYLLSVGGADTKPYGQRPQKGGGHVHRDDTGPCMTDANTDGARMVAACTSGDEATVRELLRETPSLASELRGEPLAPLHYAVREGHASIVQLLLQHGANAYVVVETLCRIPLRTVDIAAARGFREVVAIIDEAIEARQSLTLSDGPLRRALRDSDLATIQREIKRDSLAVNTTDEDGNTPRRS